MGKGQKLCPSCKSGCGPRTLICKCGYDFFALKELKDNSKIKDLTEHDIKPKTKKPKKQKKPKRLKVKRFEKVEDWTQLVKGDIIKVSGGPYYVVDKNRISIGYTGRFLVQGVNKEDGGIHCYPYRKCKESGHCFITMKEKHTLKSGTISRPHRIIKILEHK